jgi:hypothetical protein
MNYTQCVLGGYTYDVNPVKAPNPAVRCVDEQPTMTSRVYTDWGEIAADRKIVQEWQALPATQFEALDAKAALGGTLPYTDDRGQTFAVIALRPTYSGLTPGGVMYLDVKMELWVVA